MDVKSAVFALVAIREMALCEIAGKLPYSRIAIYKAADALAKEGVIEKRRKGKSVVVAVAKGYRAQKLREVYVRALANGVDPAFLTSDAVVAVWKAAAKPVGLDALADSTNLSYNWVRKIVNFLIRGGLLEYKKRKPAVVARASHELNTLLEAYLSKEEKETAYYPGSAPFEFYVKSPEDVERMLYEKLDTGISVRGTGFITRGKRPGVVQSLQDPQTPETAFLAALETPEGVEDICIRMIESGNIDYGKLLELAKERSMVNQVGCYLDILNSIKKIVPATAVEQFLQSVSNQQRIFLKALKKYGKEGWEAPFENKWNVDLYLDRGAIRHGIGGGFKGAVE
ncbi:MAG: helix-turn-helix domain-containing protein [Candidatus Thermoplasmatota archaeon]|nr:helix-turn-helix domain-containing protein [Candidatus Thermoplasmatota archaeon]